MENGMQKAFYFSVAVLVAILLFWLGGRLLFLTTTGSFDGVLYIVSGLLVLLGGICMLTALTMKWHWQIAGVLLLLGVYLLARATGSIAEPWLARVLGVASWLAACIVLYITWPGRKTSEPSSHETPQPS